MFEVLNKAFEEYKDIDPDYIIDTIELTGEASRMPFIADVIRTVPTLTSIEPSRTLNT